MDSPLEKFVLEFIAVQNLGVFKIAKEFCTVAFSIDLSPAKSDNIFTVPIACSELNHLPSNNAVWTAASRYTRPLHQSIKGLTDFSQFIPNMISTSYRRCNTVRSICDVALANVIGAPCTIPWERTVVPFPNSRNVSWGTQDNPTTLQHCLVAKQCVAPLSIKAENSLTLISTGPINRIPSSSTLEIFFCIFFFLISYNYSCKSGISRRYLRLLLCISNFTGRFSIYATPLLLAL